MPRLVTTEQFYASIPSYVTLAHQYATRIIDRGLSGQDSGVQMEGIVHDVSSRDFRMRTDDLGRIAELRRRKSESLLVVEADTAVEGVRLAIHDTLRAYGFGRRVRTWLYDPDSPIKPTATIDVDDAETTSQARQHPEGQRVNWLGSKAREYLGNLVVPGYIFGEGNGLDDESRERPNIMTYVYGPNDVSTGRHTFHQASGIGNMAPQTYVAAIAPPYTPEDAELMEGYSRETYLTAKLDMVVGIMRLAAGEA